jgi:hypothetical protein
METDANFKKANDSWKKTENKTAEWYISEDRAKKMALERIRKYAKDNCIDFILKSATIFRLLRDSSPSSDDVIKKLKERFDITDDIIDEIEKDKEKRKKEEKPALMNVFGIDPAD